MFNKLNQYSTEELRKEIEDRNKPNPEAFKCDDIDWMNLYDLIVENMTTINADGYEIKDITQYAYEEACKAVYGQDIFKHIDKKAYQ